MTKARSRKVAMQNQRRDIFGEIKEGVEALAASRKGKITLRTHVVEVKPAPSLSPRDLVQVPRSVTSRGPSSQPTFAPMSERLRTGNGRAKPDAQAALLVSLVMRFPDTVKRLAAI